MKTLVLGGVRSGKSRFAEALAMKSGLPVTYIATATPRDAEMRRRVEAHRARRPQHWATVEEPLALANALGGDEVRNRYLLVDCLTLWLTNLLLAKDDRQFDRERDALLLAVRELSSDIVLVSNETGMGIVPLGELSRRFGDEMGLLHQELAKSCDRVALIVAGLPVAVKGAFT
jgi:adenosyl cobinamide kinase/adenosyl cobinamide phosphate guanylyltransferase